VPTPNLTSGLQQQQQGHFSGLLQSGFVYAVMLLIAGSGAIMVWFSAYLQSSRIRWF
jgi:hypothetical protein